MSEYVLSPEAESDLIEIWLYLANQTNASLANKVESDLFDTLSLLANAAGLGHTRRDLSDAPVLFFRASPYQYMVVYRPAKPLEVIGVIHAKRNISHLLKERQ